MNDTLDDFKLPTALNTSTSTSTSTDLNSWQIHFGDKKDVDSFWSPSIENPPIENSSIERISFENLRKKKKGREENIVTVYDVLLEALQNRVKVREMQTNGNPVLVKLFLEQRENARKQKEDKL